MRHLLFTAAGLAMLTSLAVAQEQEPPPPPPMDEAGPAEAGPAEAGSPPSERAERGPRGDHGPRHGRGDHGPRHGRDGDRGPRHGREGPPPSKSAHFRIEKGDLKINVRCAEDEPMQVCADLTLQLIDRVAPRP